MTSREERLADALREVLRFFAEVERRPVTSIPPSLALDGRHAVDWDKLKKKLRAVLGSEDAAN